ncbi:hypothetical protein EDB87DRAFT_1824447 [Lactarius vividus]|nr:hypothetical protein EDB87DRAFT_1824447 [Lactarius vividus]
MTTCPGPSFILALHLEQQVFPVRTWSCRFAVLCLLPTPRYPPLTFAESRLARVFQTIMQRVDSLLGLGFSHGRRHGAQCTGEAERHAKIETFLNRVLVKIFVYFRLAAATDKASDDTSSESSVGTASARPRMPKVAIPGVRIAAPSESRTHLHLQATGSSQEKALDGWPTLPIAIWYPRPSVVRGRSEYLEDVHNTVFALRHLDRICETNLLLTKTLMSKSGAPFLTSFPTLEYLRLESENTMKASMAVLRLGFLGSTPRLRDIHLKQVPFSAPPLLLSTRNLVSLRLDDISSRGYFTPEALSIGLSVTTQLKSLRILFLPFASSVFRDPGSAGHPLRVYAALPALAEFHFHGNSAYLEDLISRIDAPVLERLDLNQVYSTSRNTRSPSVPPSVTSSHIRPAFGGQDSRRRPISVPVSSASHFQLQITRDDSDLQVTLLHILTHVAFSTPFWREADEMDSALWLDVFRQLKSVTRLEVAGMFVPSIRLALEQSPEEMLRVILPALQNLYVGNHEYPGPSRNSPTCASSPIAPNYALRVRGFPLTARVARRSLHGGGRLFGCSFNTPCITFLCFGYA